jgi:hypothetical protein
MRDKLLKRFLSTVGAAALALLLVPAVASADTITFDQVATGDLGTIVDLGGGDYEGVDIIFQRITHVESGLVVFCGAEFDEVTGTDTNCYLNFDTSTGSFVLTASAGLYDVDGNLLAGSFAGMIVLDGTFTGFNFTDAGVLGIFAGFGVDSKHESLLNYFGIDPNTNWVYANTEITGARQGDGTYLVNEADIVNVSVVPEPGLLALFGLGLVGAARRFSRRRV